MDVDVDLLFRELTVAGLRLRSRIVMAPMTRAHAAGGLLGPENAKYYAKRAHDGVGLIISEGAYINHPSAGDRIDTVPSIGRPDTLAGWRLVAQEVHEAGGLFFPQLWHLGLQRPQGLHGTASVGPSGFGFDAGDETWKELSQPATEAEIEALIEAYGRAAGQAMEAGCDGVELHAAHGYLIDQFFWSRTNRRTDRYGGDLVERTRFGCEVIRACKRHTRPDFPVCVRISQWKTADYDARLVNSAAEFERFLRPLVDAGSDIFHCSTRRFWAPAFEGSPLGMAGWAKRLSGKPVIAVGSVGLDAEHQTWRVERQHGYIARPTADSFARLCTSMARGEFDLIAVGRALLADPGWVGKVRRREFSRLNPYSTAIRNIYE